MEDLYLTRDSNILTKNFNITEPFNDTRDSNILTKNFNITEP